MWSTKKNTYPECLVTLVQSIILCTQPQSLKTWWIDLWSTCIEFHKLFPQKHRSPTNYSIGQDCRCFYSSSMGKPDVTFGKRRRFAVILAWATVALWFAFLLTLLPRVAMGFGVRVLVQRPGVLEKISTRRYVSTEIHTIEPVKRVANRNKDEKNSCNAGLDEKSDGDEISRLLCPSSHPSKTFAASNLEVSYLPFESDGPHGERILELLPLQKYHARSQKRRRRNGNSWDTSDSHLEFGDLCRNLQRAARLLNALQGRPRAFATWVCQ